ncbi:hypothetical protein LCGC14_1198770 [marine sediment metagenome]|uniref:Uncharacterized protein n=1 Tax=marine sediment metagenome TaxID=412755 RepID=A0A0F9LHJ8_9ZZZZ
MIATYHEVAFTLEQALVDEMQGVAARYRKRNDLDEAHGLVVDYRHEDELHHFWIHDPDKMGATAATS